MGERLRARPLPDTRAGPRDRPGRAAGVGARASVACMRAPARRLLSCGRGALLASGQCFNGSRPASCRAALRSIPGALAAGHTRVGGPCLSLLQKTAPPLCSP